MISSYIWIPVHCDQVAARAIFVLPEKEQSLQLFAASLLRQVLDFRDTRPTQMVSFCHENGSISASRNTTTAGGLSWTYISIQNVVNSELVVS
jgi:hypothetical protein